MRSGGKTLGTDPKRAYAASLNKTRGAQPVAFIHSCQWRCTCSKILQAHQVAVRGGMDEVSGGVHLDVGVLRLPHRVSAHGIEELVNTGWERG